MDPEFLVDHGIGAMAHATGSIGMDSALARATHHLHDLVTLSRVEVKLPADSRNTPGTA